MSVNFYHTYYKMQMYDGETGRWKDTAYDHQGIIVIADNINDAKIKIDEYLGEVESGDYRAVLNSDITECIGLDLWHGFNDSLNVSPITKM